MFDFKIDIKMNSASKIIKDHGLDENGGVTEFLRNEVDRYSDPYIPFKSGTLKNNKTYPNNHSIKYNSPYARIHYYGKIMVDPQYNVGGFYSKKLNKWFSRPNVAKVLSNRDFSYNGAPKRGARWEKRMMQDRNRDLCKNIEMYIKSGGK